MPAHGYLIDQFFWSPLNQRTDRYGGSPRARGQFGAEVVAECRRRVGPDFPILLRISDWKLIDYRRRLAENPQELEELLAPLVDAGVDLFDCSQRRFWEPTFAGSDLNLAGWTKKVTGVPTMTVGSVGLDCDLMESFVEGRHGQRNLRSLDELTRALRSRRVRPGRCRPRADRRARLGQIPAAGGTGQAQAI